jgi:uncharacterized protein YbjT (DUF2867 family)
MKLLVIGATRGIGRNLFEQALDEGHSVRVLVRDAERLPARHDRLDVAHFILTELKSKQYLSKTPLLTY